MEKETIFERDTKGIKFTKGFWSEDNKIKADGTNVLRALREFRNQIKAEGSAWKTAGMGELLFTQIILTIFIKTY